LGEYGLIPLPFVLGALLLFAWFICTRLALLGLAFLALARLLLLIKLPSCLQVVQMRCIAWIG
jgi:hypothetical protein